MAETRYIEGQNRYALSEMIGRGGFATVWRARPEDRSFFGGEDVAIKVIPVYNDGERSRAMREGQIAEGLRHRNIVETLEVISSEREVYLVTEFVAGLPLDEAGRYYDCAEITHSLAQVLEALVYAHAQGIIHRDIKPQNALVDRQGTVKLTDFGVAFRAGDTRLTRVGFAVGTPGYIAPEIMDGDDPTALTDIYAVGATARTLLSHHAEEPPPRLRDFVEKATSPNPSHRPQSAWAALKLLTGNKAPKAPTTKALRKTSRQIEKQERRERRDLERIPEGLVGGALRLANGAAAAYLGYLLASGILVMNGAGAAGVAVGFAVGGYLLPRLAALAIIVALAVALLQGGVAGLGLAALVPVVGVAWVAGAGTSKRGAAKLPLGPVLAVPLAVVNLAAGLPLLFGTLMRPVAAALSAAVGAVVVMITPLLVGGSRLPFYGGTPFRRIPTGYGPAELVEHLQRIVAVSPEVVFLPVLWALMAALVSVGELAGRPFVGFFASVGAGLVAYPLLISSTAEALSEAMISLGLASIMYAVLRYLLSKSKIRKI